MNKIIIAHMLNMGLSTLSLLRIQQIEKKYGTKYLFNQFSSWSQIHFFGSETINYQLSKVLVRLKGHEDAKNKYQLNNFKELGLFSMNIRYMLNWERLEFILKPESGQRKIIHDSILEGFVYQRVDESYFIKYIEYGMINKSHNTFKLNLASMYGNGPQGTIHDWAERIIKGIDIGETIVVDSIASMEPRPVIIDSLSRPTEKIVIPSITTHKAHMSKTSLTTHKTHMNRTAALKAVDSAFDQEEMNKHRNQ